MIKARTNKNGRKRKAQKAQRRIAEKKLPAVISRAPRKIKQIAAKAPRLTREPSPLTKTVKAAPLHTSGAKQLAVKAAVAAKPFTDSYDLPVSYGRTKLTLMPRDPNWIHAYWEITPLSIESVRNRIGDAFQGATRVLRMFDVSMIQFNGSNANHWFDIDVGQFTNNWYINLWSDNVSYCGELGIRTSDGRFFPLTRSNVVHTPRKNFSSRPEMMWMEIKGRRGTARPYVIGTITDARHGCASRTKALQQFLGKPRKFYLSEDDIKAYYGGLSPLLMDVVASRLSREYSRKQGRRVTTLISFERNGVKKYLSDKHFERVFLGASEESIFLGSSEFAKGGASESLPKKREFRFSVAAELIVYGATEPGAEVWLGNKKIALKEDGTFSLRLALPDGEIPLEFSAISRDKLEIRKVTTTIERETKES